jgi:hypothetical protein
MNGRRSARTLLALLLLATGAAAAPATAGLPWHPIVAAQPVAAGETARWRIAGLALPGRGEVSVTVEELHLLTPDLRFAVDGREVPVPAFVRGTRLFHGRVDGEPRSRVVLRQGGDELDGVLGLGDLVYRLTAERGVLVARQEAGTADAEDCSLLPAAGARAPSPAAATRRRRPLPVPIPVELYGSSLIVEGNYDFFVANDMSVERATGRLLGLLAQVTRLVEEEVGLRLQISRLSIWTVPDPYLPGTDYWQTWLAEHPVRTDPRTVVVLVTGTPGGGSYIGTACSAYGAPSTRVFPDGRDYVVASADPFTIAHELGHALGSDHTHCYGFVSGVDFSGGRGTPESRGPDGLPPVDQCYNGDPTCYRDGPAINQRGSLMSYCSPRPMSYGEPGLYGDHSERVVTVLREALERRHARYPGCLSVLVDAVGLRVDAGVATAVALVWNDIFPNELAWVLEQRRRNGWRVVRTLPADSTRVELRDAETQPGTTYRVHARFRGNVSQPSVLVTLPQP